MKKTILLIAGLLMFAFLATGCLGGTDETTTDQPVETTSEDSDEFAPTTAQEKLDIDTVVLAVQTKDKELCNTLESVDQKEDCIQKIDDQITFEEAMTDLDLDKCEDIQNKSKVEQCKILVEDEIEINEEEEERLKLIEEIDEQRAAEIDIHNELVSNKELKAEDCEVLKDPEFKAGCVEVAKIISGP